MHTCSSQTNVQSSTYSPKLEAVQRPRVYKGNDGLVTQYTGTQQGEGDRFSCTQRNGRGSHSSGSLSRSQIEKSASCMIWGLQSSKAGETNIRSWKSRSFCPGLAGGKRLGEGARGLLGAGFIGALTVLSAPSLHMLYLNKKLTWKRKRLWPSGVLEPYISAQLPRETVGWNGGRLYFHPELLFQYRIPYLLAQH